MTTTYFLRLEYWKQDSTHHALKAVDDVSVGTVHPHERHFRRDVFNCYFTLAVDFQEKQAESVQTLPTTNNNNRISCRHIFFTSSLTLKYLKIYSLSFTRFAPVQSDWRLKFNRISYRKGHIDDDYSVQILSKAVEQRMLEGWRHCKGVNLSSARRYEQFLLRSLAGVFLAQYASQITLESAIIMPVSKI